MQLLKAKQDPTQNVSESPGDLLTNRQAAKYLNCSTVSLWKIRKAGQVQPILVGHKMLFRRSELDRFLGKDADNLYTRKELQERFNLNAVVLLNWESECNLKTFLINGELRYRLGDIYRILEHSKKEVAHE